MKTILIVEDSRVSRKQMIRGLQKEFNILEAHNGKDGLMMAISHKPDCILSDLLMPDMDGFQLLEGLKSSNVSTPVIVISSDIQDTTRKRVTSLGAFALLNKPAPMDEVKETIRKAVGE